MKTPMIILTLAFLAGCGTYQDSLDNVPLLAADAEAGRAVFELYNCAVCHGADGQSMAPAGAGSSPRSTPSAISKMPCMRCRRQRRIATTP